MADVNLTGDFATQFFNKLIDGLSDDSLTYVMEFTGRAVGVAAEGFVGEYPEPSGKPLPEYYTRTSVPRYKYRKNFITGERERTNEYAKNGAPQQYKSKFKSLKQQHYVMALVGRGGVPYRRTGLLGRSITSDIRELAPTSVTVVVGSDDPKAHFVIGTPDEGQALYHQGTWTPLQTDLDNHAPQLAVIANAAFSKALRLVMPVDK